MITVVVGALGFASTADARSTTSYCGALKHSQALRQLSGVLADLATGPPSRSAHGVLIRSAQALRSARRRGPAHLRSVFADGYRPLIGIDRARAMSRKQAKHVRTAFAALDRRVGRRCHLPALLKLATPKAAGLAASAAAISPLRLTFRASVVTVAKLDPGLCASKADGRASIPNDFVVDACWDGSTLHLVNRTSLVQRVSGGGAPQRTDFPPQEWASWIVAHSTNEAVMPPNYGANLAIGSASASVSVSPAETRLLEMYGLTKLLVGYLPFDPLLENAVAGLVHAIDDAVARGRQCFNGANVFKKVACTLAFTASTTWAIGSFIVDATLTSIKKDAVKGTLRHAASVLWGLVQEGKYIGDVFGDIIAPGATRIAIAAAPSGPGPTTNPPPPPPGPNPPPPPVSPPPPPPPPMTWAEQETPNHPVNTFTNYHNASGMGPAVASGQWVNVSCKVYDPTIGSVNPDGYWYRIASPPWNNAYYSPANTFMNGDPYGGPYTHNTDFSVANC